MHVLKCLVQVRSRVKGDMEEIQFLISNVSNLDFSNLNNSNLGISNPNISNLDISNLDTTSNLNMIYLCTTLKCCRLHSSSGTVQVLELVLL